MSKLRITAKNPVRSALASDVQQYYTGLSNAINAVELSVRGYGFTLGTLPPIRGNEGSVNIPLQTVEPALLCCECSTKSREIDNCVSFSWYKMPSGRFEIVTYVSL